MAVVAVLDTDLADLLEKMTVAGIQHPVARSSIFICGPLLMTLTVSGNDQVVTFESSETHKWPFAVEPTLTFDDRTLA